MPPTMRRTRRARVAMHASDNASRMIKLMEMLFISVELDFCLPAIWHMLSTEIWMKLTK